MDVKQDLVPKRSALANSNVGNTVTNTRYSGGRGRGRGGNHGEYDGGRGHGRGGTSVGRGYGGQPNTDHCKPYCTHCGRCRHTRKTCWDLNSKPRNVSATAAEVKHSNETIEKDTSSQNWKDELAVLRQWLAALECVPRYSTAGITSSHNPTASSASSSTWAIDSRATDHVTGICFEFSSYTATNGRVRIANGCQAPIAGKGTVQALTDLSIICSSCSSILI